MAITKPYTFQAGTKARASEVNQDFDILYSEVNRIGTEILNIDIDIQNVAEGKADINGNAGQVFKMANPEDSYDGVNKNFLENSIANIKDYIRGFIISKDSDTSIIVSSGSCYDSTYTIVINSTGNITKENAIQGAGIRYIHAISDNTGNQTDVLISSQSISPPLPSGYTRYRLIGSYTADSDGKIKTIISYGNDSTVPHGVTTIVETYKNGASWYRVYSDGYCEQGGVGIYTARTALTITLLKAFNDTNYSVLALPDRDTTTYASTCCGHIINNGSFKVSSGNGTNEGTGYPLAGDKFWWRACGYLS